MKYYKLLVLQTFFFLSFSAFSQTPKQDKMQQLSYMTGDWIGTSKVYKNGLVTKEVPAFEKISYDLDNTILVIQLKSESLQLHTIIYYDEKDERYYYNPFSKNGARKLPAEFKDGQFVVHATDKKRFIFAPMPAGGFKEYGEKLVDGQWTIYFEDVFRNVE